MLASVLWDFFWGDITYLSTYTQTRDPPQTKVTITLNSIAWTIDFNDLAYRVRGCLLEQRWIKFNYDMEKPILTQMIHRRCIPGVPCTTYGLVYFRQFLPGSSAGQILLFLLESGFMLLWPSGQVVLFWPYLVILVSFNFPSLVNSA